MVQYFRSVLVVLLWFVRQLQLKREDFVRMNRPGVRLLYDEECVHLTVSCDSFNVEILSSIRQ